MGKVIDELTRRLRKAVDDRAIVLWFDPEQAYGGALDAIAAHPSLASVHILRHDGSHLAFRYAAEASLHAGFEHDAGNASRLIGYVPLAQAATDWALVEIAALGGVAEPGANHDLNTRLHVVAKAALKSVLTGDHLDDVVKKAEKGAFDLADLDKLGGAGGSGALDLIFETSNPAEIALKLLTEPVLDPLIVSKDGLPQLRFVLESTFGFTIAESTAPAAIRTALETFLLSVDYLARLGSAAPIAFSGLPKPDEDDQTKRVLDLVARWRSDARLQSSYVGVADRVQASLHITDHPIADLAVLDQIETFRTIDHWRQNAVISTLMTGEKSDLLPAITRYLDSFWVAATPVEERDVRWQLLETIARIEGAARQIETGLAGDPTARQIADTYTQAEAPWCELDTMQRRLELKFAHFTPEPRSTGIDDLEVLVERTRGRYRDVANRLADTFVRAFAGEQFQIVGVLKQRDIFSQVVEPLTKSGKVAYVIVDSLRFEMARELAHATRSGWKTELMPAVATIPTLTAICKAALFAAADEPIALDLKGNQLIPKLNGLEIRDPAARRKRLEALLGDRVAIVSLRALTPMGVKTGIELAKASFVLVISDEIDQAGENVDHASQSIDSVLEDLRKATVTLARVGRDKKPGETPIDQIVVVADHGHIFAGELTEGQKIDPPGSGAHRRIWIGTGGTTSDAFLRFKAKDIGLGGNLEFATPWNLSAFRAGGGTSYFHGGLSPQELLIPVLTLKRAAALAAKAESAIAWQIVLPKNQITSRSIRLDVSGTATEMLPLPERIRISAEIRRGEEVLSKMRTASVRIDVDSQVAEMDRDPLDLRRLIPAQIGLVLTGDDISPGPVSLHLIEVDTGIELARTSDIPLSVM